VGRGYLVVPDTEPHDLLIADITLPNETMVSRAASAGRLLVLGTGGPEPSNGVRVEHIAEPIRGRALLEAMERLFTRTD
jgi:hypothetical protein